MSNEYVIVTRNGNVYHNYNTPCIKNGFTVTRDWAESNGYVACSRCKRGYNWLDIFEDSHVLYGVSMFLFVVILAVGSQV